MKKREFQECYFCKKKIGTITPMKGFIKGVDGLKPFHGKCFDQNMTLERQLERTKKMYGGFFEKKRTS